MRLLGLRHLRETLLVLAVRDHFVCAQGNRSVRGWRREWRSEGGSSFSASGNVLELAVLLLRFMGGRMALPVTRWIASSPHDCRGTSTPPALSLSSTTHNVSNVAPSRCYFDRSAPHRQRHYPPEIDPRYLYITSTSTKSLKSKVGAMVRQSTCWLDSILHGGLWCALSLEPCKLLGNGFGDSASWASGTEGIPDHVETILGHAPARSSFCQIWSETVSF